MRKLIKWTFIVIVGFIVVTSVLTDTDKPTVTTKKPIPQIEEYMCEEHNFLVNNNVIIQHIINDKLGGTTINNNRKKIAKNWKHKGNGVFQHKLFETLTLYCKPV